MPGLRLRVSDDTGSCDRRVLNYLSLVCPDSYVDMGPDGMFYVGFNSVDDTCITEDDFKLFLNTQKSIHSAKLFIDGEEVDLIADIGVFSYDRDTEGRECGSDVSEDEDSSYIECMCDCEIECTCYCKGGCKCKYMQQEAERDARNHDSFVRWNSALPDE